MSGFLDPKTRVIDALLTSEGRRKLAEGNFSVKFASFSDKFVFYETDPDQGHVDPTNRFYLEAFNAPYDQITFEADDSGKLVPFRQMSSMDVSNKNGSVSWMSFYNGSIVNKLQQFSISTTYQEDGFSEDYATGQKFASQIEGILTSSFTNFNNLCLIGTDDAIFEDQNFAISSNDITFRIIPNSETIQMVPPTNVNTIDSLFSDEKLRNVENFLYLPPIKKATFSTDKTNIQALEGQGLFLGNYPPWGPINKLTFSDIKQELSKYESNSRTIYFDPTSKDNEIAAQFFEISNSEVKKLDVIDYGKVNDNSNNPNAVTHHVFFLGKAITDETGSDCFVHLFTLMFSSSDEDED